MQRADTHNKHQAFTLVELMVSLAIVILLLLMLVQMTSQTSKTWRYTTSKVEQFREAQMAFETMTRRIGQATLNTYWDYKFTDPVKRVGPTAYIRQSELRFVCGNMQNALGGAIALDPTNPPLRPTHGLFFQAPLGYVAPASTQDTADATYENLHGLDSLLNTWGYYIEVNDDNSIGSRPPLFSPTGFPTLRVRARLMELMQPSNLLTVYSDTLPDESKQQNTNATKFDWFTQSLNSAQNATANTVPQSHVLAENIIALVLLPKLAKQDYGRIDRTGQNVAQDEVALAPNYYYNSATSGQATVSSFLNSTNQLPPTVEVTMVAIDEASAARLMQTQPAANQLISDLQLNSSNSRFTSALNYHSDLEASASTTSLESALIAKKINYRIFSTTVSIRGAKWSQAQTK